MKSRSSIQVEETEDSLRLSWDNRTAPKERFLGCILILFWAVWAPTTLFVSALAYRAQGIERLGLLIWSLGGWAGTILIPYALIMRRWRESLQLDAEEITLNYSGLFARRSRVIPLEQIVEISIGYLGRQDRETMVTLNIIISDAAPFWRRREIVGYWLSAELKEQLFQAIEAFGHAHGLSLRMTKCD